MRRTYRVTLTLQATNVPTLRGFLASMVGSRAAATARIVCLNTGRSADRATSGDRRITSGDRRGIGDRRQPTPPGGR